MQLETGFVQDWNCNLRILNRFYKDRYEAVLLPVFNLSYLCFVVEFWPAVWRLPWFHNQVPSRIHWGCFRPGWLGCLDEDECCRHHPACWVSIAIWLWATVNVTFKTNFTISLASNMGVFRGGIRVQAPQNEFILVIIKWKYIQFCPKSMPTHSEILNPINFSGYALA